MPIWVVLQNIGGTSRLDSAGDAEGGLNRCLPIDDSSFPLLQYIDPYGNTFFNPNQMPELIEELERLMSSPSNQASRELLEKVRSLAIRCQGARHLYLRFVGNRAQRVAALFRVLEEESRRGGSCCR